MKNQHSIIIDNRSYDLDRRIGKGGEGEVYTINGNTGVAVKIYNASEIAGKEDKITAMVRSGLAHSAPLVAFPISLVKNPRGSFIGFAMKLINGHKPLHDLYAPGPRKQNFPQADYRFLVRTASNFARAVASVHRSHCVIGDINHSGILVSPKATVSLIDADSFQVFADGKNHLCKVGVPEYTPPELQGKSLGSLIRTPNHDAFGIAVVIFQLLFMGRHPFVGTVRRGEIPPLHENIANFRFVYTDSANVGMDQPPGTPSLSDFSPALAALFDSAFLKNGVNNRPTAEQWAKELEVLERSLAPCGDSALHFAPRGASECAWCDMERQLNTVLFLPFTLKPELHSQGTDPGAANFDIDLIWKNIEASINLISALPTPRVSELQIEPSNAAKTANRLAVFMRPFGLAISAAAVIAFFAASKLWFVWALVGFFGYSVAKNPKPQKEQFLKEYIDADKFWQEALADWYKRIGYGDFIELANELEVAKNNYKQLKQEEQNLRSQYQNDRKRKQLSVFLDRFAIQGAAIRGIGPARQATLTSYGITTAADIVHSRLISLPGFGDAISQGLLEWRRNLEHRFVYQAHENEDDKREMARIRGIVESKAIPLRRKLSVGAHNVQLLAQRILQSTSVDPLVEKAHIRRAQAKCNLSFLRISEPKIPHTVPLVPRRNASPSPQHNSSPQNATLQTRSYRPPSHQQFAPNCPRCGSVMTKRLAKKGRNAGNHFWGCTRYPGCKGTRNV